MNIKQSITYFIVSLEQMQLSQNTLRAYKQDLEQWRNTLTKAELNELEFVDFQEYLLYLHKLNLKATSLRRKRVVVHRFLKYCYDKKLTTLQLFEYIDPIKTKKYSAPKEVLTSQEITKTFMYLDKQISQHLEKIGQETCTQFLYYCSIRNRLMIQILLYTGCRATELVSLKKQDLNMSQKTITILAKGQKYNIIPLHVLLEEAFCLYQSQLQSITDSNILQMLVESPYIFPSKRNYLNALSTRTLHDLMLKLSVVLEKHIHAHLFRHTFASYCIAANMDISTVSSLISHSNPSITLSIYTHEIESNQKQKEMQKLTFEL